MSFSKEIRGKLLNYFQQKLHVFPYRTGWLRQGDCPSCGKSKKFGINLWLDRTNCFSCGYHPKPLLLIMNLENLDTFAEVYKFIGAFEEAEYLETHLPTLEEKEVKLPVSFRLLSFGEGTLGRYARGYMLNRDYKIDYLTMKGVGYCTKGPYAYRIIIPFYERGQLIYFNARQFIQMGTKHKNPPTDEFGIGKSLIIYNVDSLHIYESIYMVESATNALTLGDRASGYGGKLASAYQLSKVLRSPCKKVTILWDPDAQWEALSMALTLVKHKKVRVVAMPKEYKGKKNPDVNDIGKKDTLKLIKATPFQSYQELYSRFLNEPKPFHKLPIA